MAVRRDYIASLYRDILGREGAEHEIAGWENAPDEASVRNMFLGSPEYAAKSGGQATWHNDESGRIVSNAAPQSNQTPSSYVPPPAYSVGSGGGEVNHTYGTPANGYSEPGQNANASPADMLRGFYRRYLGRDASEDEVNKWLTGQFGWGDSSNLGAIERGISTSEEASRRRAATPGESYRSDPYTGFTGNHDYSAFNTAREQKPRASAKDAFAMVSNGAPPPPFGNKAALADWFNQYVRPGFESLGHRVLSVSEDGFTYTNHEGTFFVDFAQNAGAQPGTMQQRLQWLARPADAATASRYGVDMNGNPIGGAARPGGGGSSSALGDLKTLFGQLGLQYGGPGGPGQTKGPLEQVGQDPLSHLITGALVDFIGRGGSTAFGEEVQKALLEGINGANPNAMRRFESARELMAKGRRTMMNDARGELAHRGLLSEPGIPQGAEIGAVKRIEEAIAPEFARALRDIYTEETSKSLQLATGFAADQARTFLAGLGEGTQRQTALASIALQSLSQNMAWNQFLAEFGLKRDALLAQLQNGRVDDVMQLLNTFVSLTSLSRGGYV